MNVRRGDIVYLKKFLVIDGCLQGDNRPYLVISNDIGNNNSKIFIGVPITKQKKSLHLPTHVEIEFHESIALCEQIFTFNQNNVESVVYHLHDCKMRLVNKALRISIGVNDDA